MRLDLTQYWYRDRLHYALVMLLPFSWLFGWLVSIRRFLYRSGIFAVKRVHVPVVIVGNVTFGGTGKTPFVIWLANLLRAQGYHPGIITRGYSGQGHNSAYWPTFQDAPNKIGDETLLLLRQTLCPVVIAKKRVLAARALLERAACDIILCDDGMQHYGLHRDIEIALIDGVRRFGNRQLLPAGPLREPVGRVKQADVVVVHGGEGATMHLAPTALFSVAHPSTKIALSDYTQKKVHAVAGIGHPERFFTLLKELGFDIIPHIFPDHYHFKANDISFSDELPVIMTEKDAVKCVSFANQHCWYLGVKAMIDPAIQEIILSKVKLRCEK
ncbi:MAG TPA: tetraacyldisaccharide 4'-kinase [Gammaproteobacteria bacterium]|jgi:tetraacyldisaccharide 4'-kinase|nr:tetraacyldisaccharide 4'-kinase [Gammaproteobacteria bacterium]